MALEVVTKKLFLKKAEKITRYLKTEFGQKAANDFAAIITEKIDLLSQRPNIGSDTAMANVKSVLIGKGKQNKMYYKVQGNTLVIIDIKDIRMNPKRNRFYRR
jgi:plasmid stabilization system protein ParE